MDANADGAAQVQPAQPAQQGQAQQHAQQQAQGHKRSAAEAELADDRHDDEKDEKDNADDEEDEEDEEEPADPCCICLDDVTLPITLPCRHTFCFLCIKSLNDAPGAPGERCPLCRADIPADALQNSRLSFADYEQRLQERKRRRTEKHNAGDAAGVAAAGAAGADKNAADDGDPASSIGVWKYAGRHSGWWLFDDRANETIEDAWVQGVQWEREARIQLSIRRQQQNQPQQQDPQQQDGAAAANVDGGAAAANADGAAAPQQQQQQPQQQQQQQQDNNNRDDDDDDEDASDDDDSDDDDSDDDGARHPPPLNVGPPPNVDPLSGVNEAVALSQLDRVSVYNPHRCCSIVVGARTYVIDLHLLQQYDALASAHKRNVVRVPPETVRAAASSSRRDQVIKGQAGVVFQRTASMANGNAQQA